MFGGVMAISLAVGGVATWFGFNTFESAVKRLELDFAKRIELGNEPFEEIEALAETYNTTKTELEDLSRRLAGYQSLFSTRDGTIIDPIFRYAELDREIEQRRDMSRMWKSGDMPPENDISDTYFDPVFRHDAAQIFLRLIDAARSEDADKKAEVSANMLFNATANAKTMEMDGHARLLAEEAVKVTAEPLAHVLLRRVRMSMNASDNTNEELLLEARDALRKTSRLDGFLAFSEIWNLADLLGEPSVGIALLSDEVPEHARTASYHAVLARLFQRDGRAEHRQLILEHASNAIVLLRHEHDSLQGAWDARNDLNLLFEGTPDLFLDLSKADATKMYDWMPDDDFFRTNFVPDQLIDKLDDWMMQAIFDPG